jgi:hypothetical protein
MKNCLRLTALILGLLFFAFQKLAAQPQFIHSDTFAFSIILDSVSSPIEMDSIHNKLISLKKGRFEKADNFSWFNRHPTTAIEIEGYNILVIALNSNKILAEFRFAKQKNNVWIDEKFSNPTNPKDIKSVVYSEKNRKATFETFGGNKFELSINAQTGKISIDESVVSQNNLRIEAHIYKSPKLF